METATKMAAGFSENVCGGLSSAAATSGLLP
jgi:hypothetical protein